MIDLLSEVVGEEENGIERAYSSTFNAAMAGNKGKQTLKYLHPENPKSQLGSGTNPGPDPDPDPDPDRWH